MPKKKKEGLQDRLHQLGDATGTVADLCPKKRFSDDHLSKRVHFLIEIQYLASSPTLHSLASALPDDHRDTFQIAVMENRLNQLSLLPMQFTFARDQTFAEQRFGSLYSSTLMKIGSKG